MKGYTRFASDPSRRSGRFPWCLDCQQLYRQSHRFQDETAEPNGNICPVDDRVVKGAKNRKYCSAGCGDKVAKLKRKFGLTIQQYRAMVDAADGRCPICQKRPTEWHVDHDHKSGLVMGVVCSACNIGALASTYHDQEFVQRLLAFLAESPASRLGIVAVAPEGIMHSQLHQRWRYTKRSAKRKPRSSGAQMSLG